MRLLTGAPSNSNITMLYEETSFNSVKERIQISTLNMFYNIINSLAPAYFSALIPNRRKNVPCMWELKVWFSLVLYITLFISI